MYLPRPPVVLAACWVTGVMVCVVNAHSPVFVPTSPQRSSIKILASTGDTPLSEALSPSRAWAETVVKGAATSIPSFTRIIISLPANISFEGTGSPGDEIALYIDGTQRAATRVDDVGQWRVALAQSLPPGDHVAMAVATPSSDGAPRSSEEVRIAIPQLAPPVYAPPNAVTNTDIEPPNAATRRRAAELARDANSYFDKLTAEKQKAPKSEQRQQEPEQNVAAETQTSEPKGSFSGIAGWFARARREYDEVLVAGLSDPSRRGEIAQDQQNDLSVTPPLPVRPDDGVSYIQVAVNWLHQANRDYQEQLVDRLKIRGAVQQLAEREEAPASVPAKPNRTDQAVKEAAAAQAKQAADEKRLAALKAKEEEQRAIKARRLEEERRAAERRAAEEAERQRAAAEAEARRIAEEQRLAEEGRQRVARRAEEEAGNARALKDLLAAREKFPAPTKTDEVALAPTLSAADTDKTVNSQPAQPEPSVAPEAKASQAHVAEAVPATADIKARDVASIAVPEAKPRQVSHREQTISLPPVPEARRIVAAAVPVPIEKPDRQSKIDVRVADRDVNRSSTREGSPALDRYRWCSNPQAGRTIIPPGTYIVAYGDTLWDIAERHYNAGYLYKRIRRANRRKIRHSRWIYPCQRLWLPRLRVRRR